MALFSERYGYTKPSDVIIRKQITPEIQNAICSCFDRLEELAVDHYYDEGRDIIVNIEGYLWTNFLNKRKAEFADGRGYCKVFTVFIENQKEPWYRKMDIIECTIKFLYGNRNRYGIFCRTFVDQLNREFKRLNFAYRIVEQEIVEITSEGEMKSIESAMHDSKQNIQKHLSRALELYAQRPVGDYRNSIKESISAVEALCRELTGEQTLGKAINHLPQNGVYIPQILSTAFEKLYVYTNSPEAGIRHALMDAEATYVPSAEEALYMLVTCSAFINYLNAKVK